MKLNAKGQAIVPAFAIFCRRIMMLGKSSSKNCGNSSEGSLGGLENRSVCASGLFFGYMGVETFTV